MLLNRDKKNRAGVLGVAVLLILPLLAGCGSGDTGTSVDDSEDGSPVTGGTLTVGMVTPIQSTDPYPMNGQVTPWRRQVFNTFVGWEKGKALPQLATSWEVSDDFRELTLQIRPDVKFSNGESFTSQEAKWSIDHAEDPVNKSQTGKQLAGATVTAPDATTVKLSFEEPTPQALSVMSDVEIIWSGSDVQNNVIGTGPFMVNSIQPGVQLTLDRNPDYWEEGKPYLDKVVYKVVPDANAMVVSLKSGDLDVAVSPPASRLESLESSGAKVYIDAGPGNYDFQMNSSEPPFDNKKLRQAMGAALDRDQFAEVATNGTSVPTCQMFPPSSGAYSESLQNCSFDLEKAKELVKESGVSTPIDVTLRVPTALAELVMFAPIYQADLKTIGVNVSITPMSTAEWIENTITGDYSGMLGDSYGFGNLDPAILMTADPFTTTDNSESYTSPEYTSLAERANATPLGAERDSAFQEVSKFVQDEAFILPLASKPGKYASSSKVHGLTTNTLSMLELGNAWLSK